MALMRRPILNLQHVEQRVRAHSATLIDRQAVPNRAAVAVILRAETGIDDADTRAEAATADVLLMKRTTNPNDRWSGQVSLPGGREQGDDSSLVATAIRETYEEVAVNLETHARYVGALDALHARNRDGLAGLSVTPFVFVATQSLVPKTSAEAESVFWLPLRQVASGELSGFMDYEYLGETIKLPTWTLGEHVVWGMTHKMLSSLLTLLS